MNWGPIINLDIAQRNALQVAFGYSGGKKSGIKTKAVKDIQNLRDQTREFRKEGTLFAIQSSLFRVKMEPENDNINNN